MMPFLFRIILCIILWPLPPRRRVNTNLNIKIWTLYKRLGEKHQLQSQVRVGLFPRNMDTDQCTRINKEVMILDLRSSSPTA
ncbi:hypothetical protein ACSS6W_011016 [Trichoderma asperelloides]